MPGWNRSGICRFWGAIALFLLLVGRAAHAAPSLTVIQDVLYKANGARFDGYAFIEWKTFDAYGSAPVPMQGLTVRIVNGTLRVSLIPTTNASSGAYYMVKYNSNGRTQFTEYWAVPLSTTSLKLADVRLQSLNSLNSGGGSGSTPPGNTTVGITDVTGLLDELNARPVRGLAYIASRTAMINTEGQIESVLGQSTDCVHVDGTASPCTISTVAATFVDAEVPAGTVNGSNTTFALAGTPNPVSSVTLFNNGILLLRGVDYTLSGSIITFINGVVPYTGDLLQASYRLLGAAASVNFSDAEVPVGTINGSNASFSLGNTPYPAISLQLYRNGIRLLPGVDYQLTGNSLTFLSASVPQVGDSLQAFYRY